jgi:single-strand DNA-binding protein
MNKVVLHGNLAQDPEVKVIESKNITVANFTIAVSRTFKKSDGTKDKDVTFIPCEAWDSGAETIGKYFTKGSPILVEGSLKMEKWTDNDGNPKSRLKVRVSNFDFLNRSAKSQANSAGEPEQADSTSEPELVSVGNGNQTEENPF